MNEYSGEQKFRFISHLLSACVHCAFYYYLLNNENFLDITRLSEWLQALYRNIGISWSNITALLLTAGMLSSATVNSLRRIAEGITFGWPQYKFHNVHTCIRAWTRLALYAVFIFLVIGAYGELHSNNKPDEIELIIVAGTYIFGYIVDIFDDAVSSLFVVSHGRKK